MLRGNTILEAYQEKPQIFLAFGCHLQGRILYITKGSSNKEDKG
jgi:hypothetical protein